MDRKQNNKKSVAFTDFFVCRRKKNVKRILAGICAFCVLVSLAACGRQTETIQQTASTTAATMTETTTETERTTTETQTTSAATTTTQTTTTISPETTSSNDGTTAPSVTPGTQAAVQPMTPPASVPPTTPDAPSTALDVPSQPQTDTTVTTEPVLGITKIVNNVMVVDSGTPQARALEIFSGSFKNCERYAQALNGYKAALGDSVNVFCMVVPTSAAFYMPAEEAAKYGSQLDNYNRVAECLDGVIGVPVYSAIESHKSEYLYSRTDYHWQPLGAYYAGEQFAAAAGVPYAPLETYTPVVREGYVGAFYAVNRVSELKQAPDTFTYYKPANLDQVTCTYYNTAFQNGRQGRLFYEDNSIGASYTVFVGRDDCILQTDTNVDNGRVLVIFKDSYGNALVPFLTQSFSKIYLCDFRYFDRNAISFIREVGATDLLFAMSTVACTTKSKVAMVEQNLVK